MPPYAGKSTLKKLHVSSRYHWLCPTTQPLAMLMLWLSKHLILFAFMRALWRVINGSYCRTQQSDHRAGLFVFVKPSQGENVAREDFCPGIEVRQCLDVIVDHPEDSELFFCWLLSLFFLSQDLNPPKPSSESTRPSNSFMLNVIFYNSPVSLYIC